MSRAVSRVIVIGDLRCGMNLQGDSVEAGTRAVEEPALASLVGDEEAAGGCSADVRCH
jgi:hypothetical protein